MQVKYREGGKKEATSALYHLLPETAEMHRAKHMSEIQSEVRPGFAPPSGGTSLLLQSLKLRNMTFYFRHSTGRTERSWQTRSSPSCPKLCRRSSPERWRRRTARWETDEEARDWVVGVIFASPWCLVLRIKIQGLCKRNKNPSSEYFLSIKKLGKKSKI